MKMISQSRWSLRNHISKCRSKAFNRVSVTESINMWKSSSLTNGPARSRISQLSRKNTRSQRKSWVSNLTSPRVNSPFGCPQGRAQHWLLWSSSSDHFARVQLQHLLRNSSPPSHAPPSDCHPSKCSTIKIRISSRIKNWRLRRGALKRFQATWNLFKLKHQRSASLPPQLRSHRWDRHL